MKQPLAELKPLNKFDSLYRKNDFCLVFRFVCLVVVVFFIVVLVVFV